MKVHLLLICDEKWVTLPCLICDKPHIHA